MRGLEMLTYNINIGVCVRLQKSADTYIFYNFKENGFIDGYRPVSSLQSNQVETSKPHYHLQV